ncbi:unnamed protein product [Rotaria sp. Silwood2]|nr:unnamed protein product [Rotaria sp. Silwood2]CAF3874090.1 unnamed protein product [Rotaria sp. Silwood2]CAF4188038.1 unnamed protein product [Rotaria sp. Silwood2]
MNCSENLVVTYAASTLGLIKVHLDPSIVPRELVYILKTVGCKGIMLNASSTILHTLNNTLLDQKYSLEETAIILEHIILTGSNHKINSVPIPNAHF